MHKVGFGMLSPVPYDLRTAIAARYMLYALYRGRRCESTDLLRARANILLTTSD